ncbi:MAG: Crp/Fnr family transcriptional regulator [Paludibacteraceae bacterium]|nr:Crp/Fnr family transcriptional regulator [Paludibacteraceae bacterium]
MKKVVEHKKLWELSPVWDTLTPEEKLWLDSRVQIVRFSKNALIHSEGDCADCVWVLITGKVRIYKEGVGQRAQIIRLLKAHDFFGFRAVIAGDTYTSCASAFEPCEVYQIHGEDFMKLLRENNLFCYQFLRVLATDLAVAEIQTINLTQKHIRGRLAESLLTMRKKYGYDEDGCTLALYISREDLANMSNMTTNNAIRTLSQFAQEGLVSVDGRKIKVLDEEGLKHISRLG